MGLGFKGYKNVKDKLENETFACGPYFIVEISWKFLATSNYITLMDLWVAAFVSWAAEI